MVKKKTIKKEYNDDIYNILHGFFFQTMVYLLIWNS